MIWEGGAHCWYSFYCIQCAVLSLSPTYRKFTLPSSKCSANSARSTDETYTMHDGFEQCVAYGNSCYITMEMNELLMTRSDFVPRSCGGIRARIASTVLLYISRDCEVASMERASMWCDHVGGPTHRRTDAPTVGTNVHRSVASTSPRLEPNRNAHFLCSASTHTIRVCACVRDDNS